MRGLLRRKTVPVEGRVQVLKLRDHVVPEGPTPTHGGGDWPPGGTRAPQEVRHAPRPGLRAAPPALSSCSQPSHPKSRRLQAEARAEGRPGSRWAQGSQTSFQVQVSPGPQSSRHEYGQPASRCPRERLGGQEQDSLRNCKSRSLGDKDARNAHSPGKRPWKLG